MANKSRESIYGASVRAAAEQAAGARKAADRLTCEAWNKRMLGFQGPAQPSPAFGDALNAGHVHDHTLSATTEAAKEAFAKAVEWQAVHKFTSATISDGDRSFTIAEF
jgi:hypothetical protein